MFYCIGLGESLSLLFQDMSIAVAFLIAIGLMLIVIEMWQPSKGIFSLIGIIMIAVGVVFRMLGGGNEGMLFIMLFFIALIVIVSHIIMIISQKSMWLFQSLALSMSEVVEKPEAYEFLVGQIGLATTDIEKSGNMTINDINFCVCAEEFILKGSSVKVIAVNDNKIIVNLYEASFEISSDNYGNDTTFISKSYVDDYQSEENSSKLKSMTNGKTK